MEVDVIRAVLQIIDDSLLCSAVFPWAELAGVVTAAATDHCGAFARTESHRPAPSARLHRFPRLDIVGRPPVWSVYIVSLLSYILITMSCSFGRGVGSLDATLVVTLVDRTPWRWERMCPYCVSSDSGKCLATFLTLMRGHVA